MALVAPFRNPSPNLQGIQGSPPPPSKVFTSPAPPPLPRLRLQAFCACCCWWSVFLVPEPLRVCTLGQVAKWGIKAEVWRLALFHVLVVVVVCASGIWPRGWVGRALVQQYWGGGGGA